MQLKSLRLFLAVATRGSFVAAADEHHTVQSNVTAHIKKLEHELGCQLFERRPGQVRPTAAGLRLLEYASDICRRHDDALAELRADAAPRGRLRLGSMETTAAVRLPPLLAAFHQRFPQVDISLTTGPSADLLDGVLSGRLDGAFVASRLPHEGFHHQLVFDERLVLISGTPLARFPSPQTLLETQLFTFRQGCSYRQRVELLFAEQGLPPARLSEFGSLDAILGCVSAGMGYAVLPEAVVAAQQPRLALHYLPIEPAALATVPTYFVTPEPRHAAPPLRAFLQRLPQAVTAAAPAAPPTPQPVPPAVRSAR